MTVSLYIRQGSKRNDDSVSVEELDWSAESQVLIPAEHLWCDFICRPWAKNSSPNTMTCTFIIWTKVLGHPPFFRREKALPNCGNKDGNLINVLKNYISSSVAIVLKCMKWLYVPICHLCLVMIFWLKVCIQSHTRGVQLRLGLGFLQTSQVLPHWPNHHFSLILALYTEALSF